MLVLCGNRESHTSDIAKPPSFLEKGLFRHPGPVYVLVNTLHLLEAALRSATEDLFVLSHEFIHRGLKVFQELPVRPQ
jgi:hypothetical protein